MKTLLAASALILASSVTSAANFENWQQNPDLGTGVYDKPTTLLEPMRGSAVFTVSLDTFNEGNADHSSHARSEGAVSRTNAEFTSSLDVFGHGNADHI